MLLSSRWWHRVLFTRALAGPSRRRTLLTIAIETSCDDTSVAILEKHTACRVESFQDRSLPALTLHFHEKVTADNSQYRGINPITSLESHQACLAKLIQKALLGLPRPSPGLDASTLTLRSGDGPVRVRKPTFVTVTRGPGMRPNLFAGLDHAKGLSVAWDVPLVGVHHMQAHALTPRLVSALASSVPPKPSFPFLTLLISGGHTLLVESLSLTAHKILAQTSDIAIGDALDKIARAVLPVETLQEAQDVNYGRVLECFAYPPSTETDPYDYNAPPRRMEELERRMTSFGWGLLPPLAETRSGSKNKSMEYSFSGLDSAVRRIMANREGSASLDERRLLAREVMRVAFEHLASRIVLALKQMPLLNVTTLVVSGGVASNAFLRIILRKFLDIRGFPHIELSFPPPALCTDNAAMIAWTGMEMYEAGWESTLDCHALRKWSLDAEADDGGILGVGGWIRRERPKEAT